VQRIQVFPSYLGWILDLPFTAPFKPSELRFSWKIGTKSIGLSYHTRHWHSVNGPFPSLSFPSVFFLAVESRGSSLVVVCALLIVVASLLAEHGL